MVRQIARRDSVADVRQELLGFTSTCVDRRIENCREREAETCRVPGVCTISYDTDHAEAALWLWNNVFIKNLLAKHTIDTQQLIQQSNHVLKPWSESSEKKKSRLSSKNNQSMCPKK